MLKDSIVNRKVLTHDSKDEKSQHLPSEPALLSQIANRSGAMRKGQPGVESSPKSV